MKKYLFLLFLILCSCASNNKTIQIKLEIPPFLIENNEN